MNSSTQFKNELAGIDRALVTQVPNPIFPSEILIENVRQLLSEIKTLQIELAQAEKNLVTSAALLREAIYEDLKLRGYAKNDQSLALLDRSTENAAIFSQVM